MEFQGVDKYSLAEANRKSWKIKESKCREASLAPRQASGTRECAASLNISGCKWISQLASIDQRQLCQALRTCGTKASLKTAGAMRETFCFMYIRSSFTMRSMQPSSSHILYGFFVFTSAGGGGNFTQITHKNSDIINELCNWTTANSYRCTSYILMFAKNVLDLYVLMFDFYSISFIFFNILYCQL